MKILGEINGVELIPRGKDGKDDHVLFRLLGEDDGNWFERDLCISSYWIDDLIKVLQTAKATMESFPDDMHDGKAYGKRFPK